MSTMTSADDQNREQGTRQRILDVAARFFVERGYAGTSVRDIAAELGIANPSIYHHFKSKGELLVELLDEPLQRVETAVIEAEQLSGDARTRRIIRGLLEALEFHNGIAITAFRDVDRIPKPYRELALAMRPQIEDMVAGGAADNNRHLRVTMAIAAVEGVVTDLMLSSPDSNAFVAKLRDCQEVVVELVLGILR